MDAAVVRTINWGILLNPVQCKGTFGHFFIKELNWGSWGQGKYTIRDLMKIYLMSLNFDHC